MDTKLKNNKEKITITLVTILIVLSVSVWITAMYPTIHKQAVNSMNNYFESESFTQIVVRSTYALYSQYAIAQSEDSLTPYDVLIKNIPLNGYSSKEQVNVTINNWMLEHLLANPNIRYMLVNEKGKIVESNLANQFRIWNNGDVDSIALQKDYQFFVEIVFDADGDMTISDSYGVNRNRLADSMYNVLNRLTLEFTQQKITPIRNMKLVFAIPKDLVEDGIAYNIASTQQRAYQVGNTFKYISFGIILLFALFIPYRKLKDIKWIQALLKLPFEIWIALVIFVINLGLYMPGTMVLDYMSGKIKWFFGLKVSAISVTEPTLWLMNVGIWIIFLSITLFTVWLIKHIKYIKIKPYIKQSSMLFKLFMGVNKGIKWCVDYANHYNLLDKQNKKLIFIIVVNAILVSLFVFAWFFGIIGVVVYSFILYFILRKTINQNKQYFGKIYDVTNEIAQGNLELIIEEDLGMFNPINQNLKQIQKGFKSAVEEELKSQNMRTELISNVSHDLKTPLTSIITYVDLLKNENLPQEKRTEYVEILERKAQRLQYLIEDLFEISKLSSGNVNFHYEDIDVVALMNQTLFEVEANLEKSHLTVKKNFPENKVVLPLDSMRTYRVFENLLMNICKYAMPSSRVYLDIIENEQQVNIILKNISAQEIDFSEEEIVERFTRGDKSRNTEGSGLGLAIAKSFTELQGGKFTITLDGDLFKVMITFLKP